MTTFGDWSLTAAQREIWLSQELAGPGHDIQIAELLSFGGPLHQDCFDRAEDLTFRDFDAFRTRFARRDGTLVQVVDPTLDCNRRTVDLSTHADPVKAMQQWIDHDIARPVDIIKDRLHIFVLFKLSGDRYAWFLRIHHLIWDGYCGVLYLRRFAENYAALVAGHTPTAAAFGSLPEMLAEERAYRASEKFEDDRFFWRRQMADAPPAASLARHPVVDVMHPIKHSIVLAADTEARLNRVARDMGLPVSSLLFAAVAIYVARMTADDDVVLGMSSTGRIGRRALITPVPMVNILPLRVRVDPATGFLAVAQGVTEGVRAIARHARYRVGDTARDLGRPATEPLFHVCVNYISLPYSVALGDMPSQAQTLSTGIAQDLRFEFFGHGKDRPLELQLVFNSARYSAEEVRAHSERWRDLLACMVEDPHRPLGLLPLRSSSDDRLQTRWNATDHRLDELVWLDRFERQAAADAKAEAVRCGGESLSYATLDCQANRLGRLLRTQGVGPDVIVGICMPRTTNMIVALLGIMKAGGAYLPLQSGLPAERLQAMVKDAKPHIVVTAGGVAAALDGMVPLLELDAFDVMRALTSMPDAPPVRDDLTPEHLAYVIYTSGSTGTPKGVAVHHRALANMLAFTAATLPLAPGERAAAVTSLAFDPAALDCYAPLVQGATLVLCTDDEARDPSRFVALVRRERPKLIVGTPSRWQSWMDNDIVSLLRDVQVVTGGEAIPLPLAQKLHGAAACVWNQYGPTEATVYAACHPLQTWPVAAVPIGRPIWNMRMHVLDGLREPLPVGAVGELYIGGLGVARGYLNRPQLTAERFLDDPFGPPGGRMYRTGDLVRWREDGELEFVGRNDDQVKVRGHRVELGEVEARLTACEGVQEAVVQAYADPSGDAGLAAFYTVAPGIDEGRVSAAALRRALFTVLPEHMVPSAYVRLDALPRTHTGKLNRRALPAPGPVSHASRDHVPPEGNVEEAVAQIWEDLLQVERIGRNDGFFDLGGHSLLAVRMIARVRERLGRPAVLADAFAAPDLAAFVAALPAAAAPLPVPVPRDGPLLASPAQRRLWFLAQIDGGSAAYHIPVALRLDGKLDDCVLVRALDAMVRRQEALRTTIADGDGELLLQISSPDVGMPLTRHDLSGARDAEAALAILFRREAVQPFDLKRGPLVRALLATLGPDRHALLVTMHHIVSDGWSVGVFLRELGAFYGAYAAGREPELPGLPFQYADHAAWQCSRLTGQAQAAQAEYWRVRLAGAPALLDLPRDRLHPPRQDFAGAHLPIALDSTLAAGLRALGRRCGATLFMTVLAGFAAVLARLSGQEDIIVGTPSANRAAAHTEGLIGFFVSTLALRIDCSGDPTIAALIARVRQTVVDAQAHQDLPFEQVVDLIRPTRSFAHAPLFQVMFAWQDVTDMHVMLPGLHADLYVVDTAAAKFDLTLDLGEVDGGLVGGFTYATALFDRATVERFGAYLREVLTQMADGLRDVAALQIMPETERAQVARWSDGGAAKPIATPVQQTVEMHAARAPDAIAVTCDAATLTYRELDTRAGRLAAQLHACGVRPEGRVALFLDNDLEAVVAILAVLKAGGAYVPVDPSYPTERVAFMMADSAPKVVLTRRALLMRLPNVAGALVMEVDAGEDDGLAMLSAAAVTAPSSLAYVIYTSGSTGRPKGVMVEHRHLAAATGARLAHYPPGGNFLLLSSISFDSAVAGIFGTLAGGGRLIVAPNNVTRDPAAIVALVRREAITVLLCTPSLAHAMMEAVADDHVPGLAHVILAGETCPPDLPRRLVRWAPGARIHNEYGPTEATVWATVRHDLMPNDAPVTIGRPIVGAHIHILDERGRRTPVGVTGEIYVGGAGVARGYLNQDTLSAERFVADTHADGRLYRTGDLGRWRADGEIDYVGRNDGQVKLRGFRVEPGEIENRLVSCPGVEEAAVLLRPEGGLRLVAYVRGESGARLDGADLRVRLTAALPAHMVPSIFVILDRFPRSANGKLDRAALPPPAANGTTAAFAPPEGRIEQELAAIWSDMLGVGRVGREDDFFALGGHSLLAAGLVARINQTFLLRLPLADIFEAPGLRLLATRIKARLGRSTPLPDGGSTDPLVAFRDGDGALPHLLLIHPVGGSALCYAELVRLLPCAGPVWAMQQVGNSTADGVEDGITGLARCYVAAWLASGNTGPVHLLGWSFGGVVAFEMAPLLRRAGVAVAWLGMIDSFGELDIQMTEVPRHAVETLALELGLPVLLANDATAPVDSMLELLAEASKCASRLDGGDGFAQLVRRHRVIETNLRRLVGYRPSAQVSNLTYFRATQHSPADHERGVKFWATHATRLVAHEIDADHFTIITGQPAAEVARIVAAALDGRDGVPVKL